MSEHEISSRRQGKRHTRALIAILNLFAPPLTAPMHARQAFANEWDALPQQDRIDLLEMADATLITSIELVLADRPE